MKVYCGVYAKAPGRLVHAIICDKDTGDCYCYGPELGGFVRFSKLHITGPVEVGVPASFLWEFTKDKHNFQDNLVATIYSELGVWGFTEEELGIEYIHDAVPTTPLVAALIAENPGVDEVALRTLLYRVLIAELFTPYAARFIACAGASSQFKLSKARTGQLVRVAWEDTSAAMDYFHVFLEKHEWELSRPTKDRFLVLAASGDQGKLNQVVRKYIAPKRRVFNITI